MAEMIDVIVENTHAKNQGRLKGQIFCYKNDLFIKVLSFEKVFKFDIL